MKKEIVIPKLNLNEKKAEELGDKIIELLSLKIKENGRIDTNIGDKTSLGLGRTIEYLIERLKIKPE